jgi:DNA-binding NarL/FixJ family response regulator
MCPHPRSCTHAYARTAARPVTPPGIVTPPSTTGLANAQTGKDRPFEHRQVLGSADRPANHDGTADVCDDEVGHDVTDVLLMDIQMPKMSGVETTRRITSGDDLPNVVMVTTFGNDENVYQALRAGASGFLLKDSRPEDVIRAIRVVAEGEPCSPRRDQTAR